MSNQHDYKSYWRTTNIVKVSIPLLCLLALIGIVAGLILEGFKRTIANYPTILILTPSVIGMGGNLGSVISSRITTALHLGIAKFTIRSKPVKNNLISVFISGLILLPLLGLLADTIALAQGHKPIGMIVSMLISTVSGLMLTVIISISSLSVAFLSYKLKIDPDDTTIPIVTTVGDIMGILILFTVATLILG